MQSLDDYLTQGFDLNYNLDDEKADDELEKSGDNSMINLSKGFPWMITIGKASNHEPEKDCIGAFLNRQFAIARKSCIKSLDVGSLKIR